MTGWLFTISCPKDASPCWLRSGGHSHWHPHSHFHQLTELSNYKSILVTAWNLQREVQITFPRNVVTGFSLLKEIIFLKMHAGILFTAISFFTGQNGKSHEQDQVTHRPSAKHSSSRVSPLRMVTEDSLPLSGGGNNSLGFLCLIEFATEQNRTESDFVQTKKLLWHSILPKTYLTIWTCVCVCIFTHTF